MRAGIGMVLLVAVALVGKPVSGADVVRPSRQAQPPRVVRTYQPSTTVTRRTYSLMPDGTVIGHGAARAHRWSGLYPHEIIDARTGRVVGVTHEYQFGYDRIGSNW